MLRERRLFVAGNTSCSTSRTCRAVVRGNYAKPQLFRCELFPMFGMPGFISWVGASVGNRMMTSAAWETPEATAQMMKGGEHRFVVGRFFGPS